MKRGSKEVRQMTENNSVVFSETNCLACGLPVLKMLDILGDKVLVDGRPKTGYKVLKNRLHPYKFYTLHSETCCFPVYFSEVYPKKIQW